VRGIKGVEINGERGPGSVAHVGERLPDDGADGGKFGDVGAEVGDDLLDDR
jgi:hypothetical protein